MSVCMVNPALLHSSTQHGPPILRRLPNASCTAAEVGVCRGILSEFLLSQHGCLHLTMVDAWREADAEAREWSRCNGEPCNPQSQAAHDANHEAALAVANRYAGRVHVLPKPSPVAAAAISDATFDLVFIDADHREASVRADIEAWWPKVKPGGWIGGHDYGLLDRGVDRAVNEFAASNGLQLELDAFFTWFIRRPI